MTIQRNLQHRQQTQDKAKQDKNTTQYAMDTTMRN